MSASQIKASYFAGNVAALAVLGPAGEQQARHALRAELAEFSQLSRADWVPVAWDVALTQACRVVGGDAAIRAVNRASFLSSVDGPLLRPILNAAVSMLRVGPRPFLRVVAHGWQSSTRELGRVELYGKSNDDIDVGLVGLPTELLADRPWLEGFSGVLEGVLQVSHLTNLSVSSPQVDGGRALFAMRDARR